KKEAHGKYAKNHCGKQCIPLGSEYYYQSDQFTKGMKLYLLLDYDGTLTPIAKKPLQAVLSSKRKKVLRQLACHPSVKLAVVSGRELSFAKKIIGIRNIIYVGNHGLEIFADGKYWMHPGAKKAIPLLKRIKTKLMNNLHYRGIWIEDKGLTLSIHYRFLNMKKYKPFKNDLMQNICLWKGKVAIMHGKKVFEIRPPVKWDKGAAVRALIPKRRTNSNLIIYIGDDTTDEDAFRALKNRALTFRVGMSGQTCAKYRLKNTAEVYKLLSAMTKLIKGDRRVF
ncbi:MAG: trehalose-phosphatase, partial [Candidatus Margulisbacteria bacterium]|nr:trehalose-phosphatase [Candidatus Margulisiibacteriota bacterium]